MKSRVGWIERSNRTVAFEAAVAASCILYRNLYS